MTATVRWRYYRRGEDVRAVEEVRVVTRWTPVRATAPLPPAALERDAHMVRAALFEDVAPRQLNGWTPED